ncbi:MAG: tyrosinase family protein [Actinomycetota bacterium]|nr:tyrosinase family protein [Actinomycetota bacterium]
MAEQLRVRRDIWSLEGEKTWHPITRAYALAIAEMQTRDPSDPTSWQYQSQIHGMPDGSQPDQFRGQCQHQSWFFLPWHRLYLYWFQQTVLAAVQAHPDIDDDTKAVWALPYWNYSPGGQRGTLPAAFRQHEHPDDPHASNPLFVANRNDFVNDGEELDPLATRVADALAETVFSLPRPAGGFGGAATGFNHFNQDPNFFPGMLEQTPHNDVHQEVGGDMAGFHTAGLDPVFWMHHANIDRLWVVWIGQEGRVDPDPNGTWGTTISNFHDPAGEEVSGSASGALNTEGLGYVYEDTSQPEPLRRRRAPRVPSEPPPDQPAELVGATEDPVELTGGTKRVALSVGEPTGPAGRRGGGQPERVYLTVEGIEGEQDPGVTYAVFVNLPDDADVDEEPERHYAGNVSFFGIEQTRQVATDPGGHGLARSFDITDLVSELRDADSWDPDEVTVTFVPLRRGTRRRRGASDAEGEGPPVNVGRVGVYFQ